MLTPVYRLTRRTLIGMSPLVLMGALLLSGCGGSSGPINYQGNGRSGVRGTAYVQNADGTRIPLANGEVAATITHCPPAGMGIPCSRDVVARTTTDAQGHYTLSLITGTYNPQISTSTTGDYGGLPSLYIPDPVPFNVKVLQYSSQDLVGVPTGN